MSHEITETDHMVSCSNTVPWHGLGTVLANNITAAEALIAARLNWQVIQEPVFDGDMTEICSHHLNRRSDTREVLSIVSRDWEPLQNERLLEIAEALVQVGTDFKPVIETAGSLKGGRIVWALVKTGERNFAGSQHHTYLLLSNGHDGLRGIRGTLTDTRVVCNNTLRVAETAMGALFVTHTKGVETRVNNAIEALGWANDATRATFAIYGALATARVSIDTAHNEYRRLVVGAATNLTDGQRTTIEKMTSLFRDGHGNEGKTAFDFVNGATEWVDHHRNYRENEGKRERRFITTTFGDGATLKSQAFRVAKQLAGI
jgi:phage/plasmid-like protein (TIGR03299 family)